MVLQLVTDTADSGGLMIVIVDDNDVVTNGYTTLFGHAGVAAAGLKSDEFDGWVCAAPEQDLNAIEAFLIGSCGKRGALTTQIRQRSDAAVIAISDSRSLDETISLFDSGVDDVVRKPVHVREILARIAAIRRRVSIKDTSLSVGQIRVFPDGRDPEVAGEVMVLPRRERRILEYLVSNYGRRVTKSQIFNSVYGLFDHEIDDNVIESHISKLRKRLKNRLNIDLIDCKRHIGYAIKSS